MERASIGFGQNLYAAANKFLFKIEFPGQTIGQIHCRPTRFRERRQQIDRSEPFLRNLARKGAQGRQFIATFRRSRKHLSEPQSRQDQRKQRLVALFRNDFSCETGIRGNLGTFQSRLEALTGKTLLASRLDRTIDLLAL